MKKINIVKEIETEIIEFLIKILEEDIYVYLPKWDNIKFGEFVISFYNDQDPKFFLVRANKAPDIKIVPRYTWKKTPIRKLYRLLNRREKEEKIMDEKKKHETYLSKLPKESQLKIDRRIKLKRVLK